MVRTGDDIRALRWSALNAFFKFLKSNDYVNENIVERTNRPEIRTEHTVTYLEKDEIGDLLRNVRNTADRKRLSRDLCMISLFLATGLREGAVTQINVDDVDLKNNVITVIEKGDKKRKIQFGDNLKELLIQCMDDRYTNFCRIDSDALFLSKNGTRMTTQAVRDLVKKYTKVIKGKHITPHKLRATAATSLAANGASLQAIANQLGHANIATTRKYVEVLDKEKQEVVNMLDNLI
jgi:site-specific recombinase XerD